MPFAINIINQKINNVTGNASVNYGNTHHNGHVVNLKAQGTSTTIGDFSPMNAPSLNNWLDQKGMDQVQVGNPRGVINPQV